MRINEIVQEIFLCFLLLLTTKVGMNGPWPIAKIATSSILSKNILSSLLRLYRVIKTIFSLFISSNLFFSAKMLETIDHGKTKDVHCSLLWGLGTDWLLRKRQSYRWRRSMTKRQQDRWMMQLHSDQDFPF